MNKFLKIAAAAAIALGAQVASADVLLLDDFTVSQNINVAGGAIGGNTVGNGTTSCAHILGCYRDVVIDNSTALGPSTAFTVNVPNANTPNVGGGPELRTNVGSGDHAKFILTWDGDATHGNLGNSLGADLTAFFPSGGFEFLVKSDGGLPNLNQVGPFQQVSIELLDGTGKSSYTQFTATSTLGGPDGYFVATFNLGSEFLTDAGFDWSNVASIQAIVDVNGNTESLDFSLRAVNLVVPEPASIALTGLALLGLGAARRRKA